MSVRFNHRKKVSCNKASLEASSVVRTFVYAATTNASITYGNLLGTDQLVITGLTSNETNIPLPPPSALLDLFNKPQNEQILEFFVVNQTAFSAVLTYFSQGTVAATPLYVDAQSSQLFTLQVIDVVAPEVLFVNTLIGPAPTTGVVAQRAAPHPGVLVQNVADGFTDYQYLLADMSNILVGIRAGFIPGAAVVSRTILLSNNLSEEVQVWREVLGPSPTAHALVATLAPGGLAGIAISATYNTVVRFNFVTSASVLANPGTQRLGTSFNVTVNVWDGGTGTIGDRFYISTVPPGAGVLYRGDATRSLLIENSRAVGFTEQQSLGYSVGLTVTSTGATTQSVTSATGVSPTVVTYPDDTAAPRVQLFAVTGGGYSISIEPTV